MKFKLIYILFFLIALTSLVLAINPYFFLLHQELLPPEKKDLVSAFKGSSEILGRNPQQVAASLGYGKQIQTGGE